MLSQKNVTTWGAEKRMKPEVNIERGVPRY